MASSADSLTDIDELIARRTIQDYETFNPRFFEIVRINASDDPHQAAEELTACTSTAAADLISILRFMTPPVDQEAEDNESRLIEAQARESLKSDGCPPCYPSHLEVPLRNIPKEYEAIVSYWKSFSGTGDVVLQAQLSDWKRFRKFQERVRHYYRHRNFNEFVDQVFQRRRRHGLEGDVRIPYDISHDWQTTCFEFQDWHLQQLEGIEKERDELVVSLDNAQAARDANVYKSMLEVAEGKLTRYDVLLHWTEQERLVTENCHSTPVERLIHESRVTMQISPVAGHKDQPGALATSRQAPKHRQCKQRRETLRRQLLPQRVSKTNQHIKARAKLRHGAKTHSLDQGQLQQSRLGHLDVQTRSGRTSRRPERWGFQHV